MAMIVGMIRIRANAETDRTRIRQTRSLVASFRAFEDYFICFGNAEIVIGPRFRPPRFSRI